MSKFIDISGQRFGFWTVLKRVVNVEKHVVQWLCLCDCGNQKIVTTNSLRSGNSTSCGCNHSPDLNGMIFGNLTVLEIDAAKSKHSKRYWTCLCKCGKTISVSTNKLRSNKTTSCGCLAPSKLSKLSDFLKDANKNTMLDNMRLIKEQTVLVADLNKEIQKSIDLIASLRLQIKKPVLD